MKSSFTRLPFEPETILIPTGEFLMSSDPPKDPDAKNYELPRHTVHLGDYCLSKTLITNAQPGLCASNRLPSAKEVERWRAPERRGRPSCGLCLLGRCGGLLSLAV